LLDSQRVLDTDKKIIERTGDFRRDDGEKCPNDPRNDEKYPDAEPDEPPEEREREEDDLEQSSYRREFRLAESEGFSQAFFLEL
jgi:hypothetical protein